MRLTERELVETVEELTLRRVRVCVRKGWVVPREADGETVYDEIDVARLRLICHLKDEIRLDEQSLAMVLALMDQVYGLRRELRRLGEAVERQPADTRRRIARALSEFGEG